MSIFKDSITKKPSRDYSIHRRSLVWIGLAILCLVLDRALPTDFWEKFYYQGFFTWVRRFYDLALSWHPVPLLYIWIIILLVRGWLWFRERKKGWIWMASKAIGGVAMLVFLFYMLWAFNYRQISLPQRLGFNFDEVTPEDIADEFKRASSVLRMHAESLPEEMTSDSMIQNGRIDVSEVRNEVQAALRQLGLPHNGKVHVREILPKGALLRWSTAGIYIPQTMEGHIDAGLLSVQKPFTMAHEMAHGYGVADEGACNFIAWHTFQVSRNPWFQFSSALTYWRYVAAEMHPDTIKQMMETFPPVVKRARELIIQNDERYPDLMPRYRDAIYSTYLRRHGVKQGLRSYNEVVLMVQQYLKKSRLKSDPE